MNTHIPVLQKEVLQYLDPKPSENFIDATVGEGGHAISILEKNGPEGKLLGIDLDSQQVNSSKNYLSDFEKRIILVNDSYVNLKEIVERENFKSVHGILLDLGMSSWQLEKSGKGFSFLKDEALDMRYSLQNTLTAEKVINEYPEKEIEKILIEYGEEKFARQITMKIVQERTKKEIKSTFELRDIIKKATSNRRGNIHLATRTFQALRIEVNGELANVKKVLPQAIAVLAPGGRLAVISFHSLEDRIVKNFFKGESEKGIVKVLTKKPIVAGYDEVVANPRARSAKLRAIVKK